MTDSIRLFRTESSVATTTATATAVSATATAAATATAPEAAATAAAATTVFLGSGFVDLQRPAIDLSTIKVLNRSLGLCVPRHLDECKPARLSRIAVRHDADRLDLPYLTKQLFQVLLGRLKGQISHIQFNRHVFSSFNSFNVVRSFEFKCFR
jgi:hypothetical protein